MPFQPEVSYFVRLDAPPPPSRYTGRDREAPWSPDEPLAPPPRRRRRRTQIRPAGVFVLAVLAWLGWAYTTPGGPSARIRGWIDHTRGDIADVSANPNFQQPTSYFNGQYAQNGRYPDPSDTDIQQNPQAGLGPGTSFIWCGPNAVVLQTLSSGGSVSRLLLDGSSLGNVPSAHGCPTNLANPLPWKR